MQPISRENAPHRPPTTRSVTGQGPSCCALKFIPAFSQWFLRLPTGSCQSAWVTESCLCWLALLKAAFLMPLLPLSGSADELTPHQTPLFALRIKLEPWSDGSQPFPAPFLLPFMQAYSLIRFLHFSTTWHLLLRGPD